MSNDKKALIALMDLVLALADYATTPPGHRSEAVERVRVKRQALALGDADEVPPLTEDYWNRAVVMRAGVQERATRPQGHGAVVADGQAARTAVAATERRMRAWYGLEGLEADDSRITDSHKQAPCGDGWCTCGMCANQQASEHRCCGGKPDCGCARSVGG